MGMGMGMMGSMCSSWMRIFDVACTLSLPFFFPVPFGLEFGWFVSMNLNLLLF